MRRKKTKSAVARSTRRGCWGRLWIGFLWLIGCGLIATVVQTGGEALGVLPTRTPTPPPTFTATATLTPTLTNTPLPTLTFTVTPTPTASNTPLPTATPSKTPLPTNTRFPTATPTITLTPTASDTPRATSTAAARPTNTPLPTVMPTNTLVPTATATWTPQPTATVAVVVATPTQAGPVVNRDANLRAGPGTEYAIAGAVGARAPVTVVGRNSAGDWYQLASGEWIAAFLVDGAPGDLPVAAVAAPIPPTPTAIVSAPAVPTATTVPPAIPATATAIPPTPAPPAAMPVAGNAVIVIVENRSTAEILGIYNGGGGPIDISGWRLDGSKGDDYCVMPGGVVLRPGETYHVATGDSEPFSPGYKCGNKPIWNNDGETIFLHATDGQIVHEITTRD